jgi:hypothetical protein
MSSISNLNELITIRIKGQPGQEGPQGPDGEPGTGLPGKLFHKVFKTPGKHTFKTSPTIQQFYRVFLWGGGGGGGVGGGGGGSSCFIREDIVPLIDSEIDIIVGAGGDGGAIHLNGSNGKESQISYFDSSMPEKRQIITAGGGGGGKEVPTHRNPAFFGGGGGSNSNVQGNAVFDVGGQGMYGAKDGENGHEGPGLDAKAYLLTTGGTAVVGASGGGKPIRGDAHKGGDFGRHVGGQPNQGGGGAAGYAGDGADGGESAKDNTGAGGGGSIDANGGNGGSGEVQFILMG